MIFIGNPTSLARIRTRSLELMLAALMVTCGLTLLWPGETFLLPQWQFMRSWAREGTLGVWLICIGVMRWIAIWINGRWTQSPLWRIVGCCIGGFIWLGIFFALWEGYFFGVGYWQGLGVPLFLPVSCTCFFFEVYAGYRCGIDAADYDSFGTRRRAWDRKHARDDEH